MEYFSEKVRRITKMLFKRFDGKKHQWCARKTNKKSPTIIELVNSAAPPNFVMQKYPVTKVNLERPLIPLSLRFWFLFIFYRFQTTNQVAYLIALIKYLKAQMVYTFTDNYSFLGALNSVVPTCRVVSIGSGFRTRDQYGQMYSEAVSTFRRRECSLHDIYLCWGERDARLILEAKMANKVIPIGSLRDQIYRDSIPKYSNDIELLVSFHRIGLLSHSGGNTLDNSRQESARRLLQFLKIFCGENHIVPVFLLRPGDEDYIKKQISEIGQNFDGHWTPYATENNSDSYAAIAKSDVVVGIRSSILVEALGHRKKVLACNLTNNSELNLFESGLCQITSPSYFEFSQRLLKIRNMTQKEWIDSTSDLASEYILGNNIGLHKKLGKALELIAQNQAPAAFDLLRTN